MDITLKELEAKLLEERLKSMFQEAYEQGLNDARKKYELPPLLSRKKFMELVGIADTKCAELFNRSDFPVIREFGHPKVPTHLLFIWIEENTEWVQKNTSYFEGGRGWGA